MVVQSETLSVESWGMTSTDSSLYRSSESDYCSILDPIPVADAQVPEPAVLQSEVQGADAVEGADDMDPRGMPEVSLNAVQESAAENSDLEDAASATIDGVCREDFNRLSSPSCRAVRSVRGRVSVL